MHSYIPHTLKLIQLKTETDASGAHNYTACMSRSHDVVLAANDVTGHLATIASVRIH